MKKIHTQIHGHIVIKFTTKKLKLFSSIKNLFVIIFYVLELYRREKKKRKRKYFYLNVGKFVITTIIGI